MIVFSKPARAGRVKTRLIGDLTPGEAAELSAAFLGDVLERLGGGEFDLRVAWALEDGEEAPFAEPPGERQQGSDLGERLFAALSAAGRRYPLVAAVGSDHPTLPLAHVERAFELLAGGGDLVLGPADDGGYYLVAARASALGPALFAGVPWSTERVLAETLARSRSLGLAVELLPAARDVDTPADLAALAAALAAGEDGCPRTRALLASWGRLA